LEGLSDVGFLMLPLFTEDFVVGFAALVVPCDIILVAFVDAFGVGGKMGSFAVDTFQGMGAYTCIISGFLDRTTACGEQVMILGLMGLTASGALLVIDVAPGSTVGP
jgi:hypothetical protein